MTDSTLIERRNGTQEEQQAGLSRRAVVGLSLSMLAGGGLVACSSTPKPTPIAVQIDADSGVNPGETGEPSPVVVRIYELRGIKAFSNANYFDFDDDTKLLGADLIASREYEMTPGSQQVYDSSISPEAAYVGVIAGFRDIQSAQWRDSIELKKSSKNKFVIYITGLSVRIQTMKTGWFG